MKYTVYELYTEISIVATCEKNLSESMIITVQLSCHGSIKA